MKHTLCSIKDNAIQAFQQVFSVRHPNEAIRSFSDAINNPQSPIGAHATDYELYIVGTYEDETGEVTAQTPSRIARGQDLKQQ